ncbi:SAF domain-containing protein [Streptomyces xinghaiensis]|uniref:SAF domain-containing protein n=1 Tax=Streptomyces xinghaiensis TaxID=1038928 RepID=UPI0002D7EA7D|nr:SAF domain-containing protein [Streptomyces xinghaiensis]
MSKTEQRTANPGPGETVPPQFTAGGPVAPPQVSSRRRRPGMIALSLALIAAGGAAGAVLWLESGQRTQVVTVVRPVPVGQQITERDLGRAAIALDPAVKAVTSAESVIGKRAAVELTPGSLLSPAEVTDTSLVADGEALVPIGLKPEQVPATDLAPGQPVQIVQVPGPDQEPEESTAQPSTIAAKVVKVGEPSPGTGTVVVDVAAPATDAPALAAWASSGNVRLIVDSRDGS